MNRNAMHSGRSGAYIIGRVASIIIMMMVSLSAFGQFVVTQTTPVNIPQNQPSSPYPSSIGVSNVVGNLEKVTVTLNNLTHGYANDIVVMLVAPNGNSVVLMGNAGGGQPLNGVNASRLTTTLAERGAPRPRRLLRRPTNPLTIPVPFCSRPRPQPEQVWPASASMARRRTGRGNCTCKTTVWETSARWALGV